MLDERSQTPAAGFDPALPTVVMVDGYSSGRLFAPALDMQVVHVQTTGTVPKDFAGTFWPRTYNKTLFYENGRLNSILRKLRQINVVAVLPGTDTGVLAADVISAALHRDQPKIPSNGIDSARKNKFEMSERLKKHGLEHIMQMRTRDVAKAIRWVRRNNLLKDPHEKVVVKPLASAGGENVMFPNSEDEIRLAFKKILGTVDKLGNSNVQALIQEYVPGTEYVVNSTMWKGRKVIDSILMYQKRVNPQGQLIYDHDVLLPYEGKLQERLRAYDRKVQAALGITHGNSHSEIMMVEGRGPVLIESNSRPMGSSSPGLIEFATGRSQISLTALALSNPKAFRENPMGYTLRKNAIVFSVANLYGRKMRFNPAGREKLRRLPGFFQDLLHVKSNRLVPPTEDLFNSPGEIWLLHEDLDVLYRTVDELHTMELDGTLFIEP